MTLRAALLQLTSSDDPAENLAAVTGMVERAAADGAEFVLTPEVTNLLSASRAAQQERLADEAEDRTLAALREQASRLGIWLSIGSLALKSDDPEGRFVNRSFLVGPDGGIRARYDKIHMFDVTISEAETYRESAGYRPGERAVVAATDFGAVGLSICYDLRFPALYRALAQAGAEVILIPSAFAVPTGRAHWEVLLRARAIETGCFVLAAAQVGSHAASQGKQRKTWGHSMAVAPWGEVLLDAGTEPGVHFVDLDLGEVTAARGRIPSLTHDRAFAGP